MSRERSEQLQILTSLQTGNAELVARAADLARLAQRPPMSPDGVRAIEREGPAVRRERTERMAQVARTA